MEIKILGTGCSGCKALFQTVETVVEEMELHATLVKEEDMMKITAYSVMRLPALVVDGNVVAQGKLSAHEVKNLLARLSEKSI